MAKLAPQTAGEASLFSDSAPLLHLNQSPTLHLGRPQTHSPLSALLLSRNLLFFKVFLPRCDVLQAPRPISLLLCQTDETIHLPAPPHPHSPTHPRLWLRPRSLRGRRQARLSQPELATWRGCGVLNAQQRRTRWRTLPRGINIFTAAPAFWQEKGRIISESILT